MTIDFKDKQVIISGGAGFLGRHLVAYLLSCGAKITVISRDEHKHQAMQREFPSVNMAICDVRDYDMLRYYTRGHDFGIWAASLKHIDTCEKNWQMAKEIIVDGAINSRKVSEEFLQAAAFISTDKSKSPTTLYGQLKAAAGEMFILNSNHCKLSSVVYGNVWNSTGSVVQVIWEAINKNLSITLYSPDMTRFMIEAEHAVDMVIQSLELNSRYIIPKLHSFRVLDLFQLYEEKFGLVYKIGRPRTSEKIHEVMATIEESPRMSWHEKGKFGFYSISPNTFYDEISFPSGDYSSKDYCISKCELQEFLEIHHYFKPSSSAES